MGNDNKTVIRLLGIDYPVVSNTSEEEMQKIAFYVDKHFNEVKQRNSRLSTTMIATLAAINIAEEYFAQKEDNDNLIKQMSEYIKRCERNDKELKECREKLDEQLNEIQKLKIDIAKLEINKRERY